MSQKNVFEKISDMIGKTPLLRLNSSLEDFPGGRWLKKQAPDWKKGSELKAELYAKVEYLNPGASVKDRIAKYIIEEAEKRGELKMGGTIIEATSGNTGAGLAMLAAAKGYKAIFVMPDKMSAEKINVLRAYGAKVVIAPNAVTPDDPRFYCNVAARLAKETPNSFLANQYFNPDNPKAHFESTGPEIWEQMGGDIDVFIAGIGTGGTLSGVAHYLKDKNPNIQIIAIDPKGSIYSGVIKDGKPAEHHPYIIEGIGQDMIPGTMDIKCVSDCVTVWDDESVAATRMLAQKEGLLVGGSCGTAFFGALAYLHWAQQKSSKKLRAVVLLPDSGSRYLSKIFNSGWLEKNEIHSQWGELELGGGLDFIEGAKRIEGL